MKLTLVFLLFAMAAAGALAEGGDGPRVVLDTTEGRIVVELDRERAPKSVENFLGYVDDGFYDGTVFHRVIPGFMNQGGGYTADLALKPTREPIQNEADNGLRNTVGTLAMARKPDPHSATAQFFINTADNAFLDHTSRTPRGWGYAVFGRVVEGMDVVQAISGVPTQTRNRMQDVPAEPVVIRSARRVESSDAGGE